MGPGVVKVYRFSAPQRARDLSGRGAELYGGRWNAVGTPALYAAANPSLALLEVLVNTPQRLLPPVLSLVTLDLPLKAEEVAGPDTEQLPKAWRSHPAPAELTALGQNWLQKGAQLIWKVPSAVLPVEHNYLINPRHPRAGELKIEAVRAINPDPRMQT